MSGDIPQDIMAAAEDAYLQAIYMTDSDEPGNMVQMVANAVLAERERCADVIETLARVGFAITPDEEIFAKLAASVIRKGDEPPPLSGASNGG